MQTPATKADLASSFEPTGAWFAFDTRTGRTVKRGFASRVQADGWISRQHGKKPEGEKAAA